MDDLDIMKELEALGAGSDVEDILTGISATNSTQRRRNEDNISRLKCPVSDCDWQHQDTIPESQLEPDRWELTDEERDHIQKYHRRLHIRLQNYETDKNFQQTVLKHQNTVLISEFMRKCTTDRKTIPLHIIFLTSLMYQCDVILIIGDSKVGKTSLLNRYMHKTFRFATTTTQFKIMIKEKDVDKLTIFLDLTGDQEMFDKYMLQILNKFIVRLVISGLIFVYDINDEESFESVESIWMIKLLDQYKNHITGTVPMFVMGNKCDYALGDQKLKQELKQKGQQLADKNNMIFYEVSAASDFNVTYAFEDIQKRIK